MVAPIAAVAAATGFFVITCFQILLALGFPLGRAAWGGKYEKLPPSFRIASLFSAGIMVFASILVLEKANVFSSTIFILLNRNYLGDFHRALFRQPLWDFKN